MWSEGSLITELFFFGADGLEFVFGGAFFLARESALEGMGLLYPRRERDGNQEVSRDDETNPQFNGQYKFVNEVVTTSVQVRYKASG